MVSKIRKKILFFFKKIWNLFKYIFLPFEEISIWPELSSPVQRGGSVTNGGRPDGRTDGNSRVYCWMTGSSGRLVTCRTPQCRATPKGWRRWSRAGQGGLRGTSLMTYDLTCLPQSFNLSVSIPAFIYWNKYKLSQLSCDFLANFW